MTERRLVAVENGQVKWRQPIGARVATAPLVAGGRVFVLGVDRAIQAFDASDGARLWQVARPGDPLARKSTPIQTSELRGAEVLLLDDGHCFRDQALEVCGQAGAVEQSFRATSLGTLVQMVSTGDSVTLLPTLALPVENRRSQLRVRRFTALPYAHKPDMAEFLNDWAAGFALRPIAIR